MKLYSVQEKQAPREVHHRGDPLHVHHCPHCDADSRHPQTAVLAERGYYDLTLLCQCGQCGEKFTSFG